MLINSINWLGIKRSSLTQIEIQTTTNGLLTINCGSKQEALHRYNGCFDVDNFWQFIHTKPVGGPISINIGNILQTYRIGSQITIEFKDGTIKILTFSSEANAQFDEDYINSNFNNYWAITDIDSFEGNYTTVVTVPVGGSIQTAINNASAGTLIKLADGTHTVTNEIELKMGVDMFGTKNCTLRNISTGQLCIMKSAQPAGTFNFYGLTSFKRITAGTGTDSLFMVQRFEQRLNIFGYDGLDDLGWGFYTGEFGSNSSGGSIQIKLYSCDSIGSMFDGDYNQEGYDIDVRRINARGAVYFPDPNPNNSSCKYIHRGGYVNSLMTTCENYGIYIHWNWFSVIFNMNSNVFFSDFSSGQHLYEFTDVEIITSASSWTGFSSQTELFINDGFLLRNKNDANVITSGNGQDVYDQYAIANQHKLELPLINSGEIDDINIVIGGSDMSESIYVWKVLKDTDPGLVNKNIDWCPTNLETSMEYTYTQYINLVIKPLIVYTYAGIGGLINKCYYYNPEITCVLPFYQGSVIYPSSVNIANTRSIVNVTAGVESIGTDWEYGTNLEFMEECEGMYLDANQTLVKDEVWTNMTQSSPSRVRMYSTTGLPYFASVGNIIHVYDVSGFGNNPTGRFVIKAVVNNAWPNNYIEIEHDLDGGTFVAGKGRIHFLSGATAVCAAKLNLVRKGRDQSWWDARYSAQRSKDPWVSQFGYGPIDIINAIAYNGTIVDDPNNYLHPLILEKFYAVPAVDQWNNPYKNTGVRTYQSNLTYGTGKVSLYQIQDGSGSINLLVSDYGNTPTYYFAHYDNDTGAKMFQGVHSKRNGSQSVSSIGFSNPIPPRQSVISVMRHKVSSPLGRLLKNINKKGPST